MGKVIMSGIVPQLKVPDALPSGFTKLAYIESTGTQWVDTEFVPNGRTRMVLDFAATEIPASSSNSVAGSRKSTTEQSYTFSTVNGKWRMGYNNASPTTTVVADTNRHIADLNQNVLSLDGNIIHTLAFAEFEGNCSICIGIINSTAANAGYYKGYAKFYSCQIYDDGTLIRNYQPCVDPSGNIGLYDKVNKKFYGNAGTGAFIGSEVA